MAVQSINAARKVLVTGASRGIGRGVALALSQNGYDVAFCYQSSDEKAQQLAVEIQENGVKALPVKMDISKPDNICALFDTVAKEFGGLDLLVNNAGITRDGLLATMSVDDMMSVIQVNLLATLLSCREAVKIMIPQRHGNIINISSISASKPNKGQCNYAASKAGVEGFTRALAVEVARKNIRVNCIAPGVIETDMVDELLEGNEDFLRKKILGKRFGHPNDISKAVLYLADPENDFVSGEIINVNGGMKLL